MRTVTLRLPEDTAERLKLGTAAVAAHDTEVRFRALAAGANPKRALAVLDRLDELDRARP